MNLPNIVIPVVALLLLGGCTKQADNPDIDMGARGTEPAAPAAQTAPADSPKDLKAIPAGEGQTTRVIATCNIEQVNGQAFTGSPIRVSKNGPVAISGWVIDEPFSGSAELRLVSTGDASTYGVDISTDVARDDVVASFKADASKVKPGFNLVLNARPLAAGDYHLQIVVPSVATGAAACDNGRVISLAD